MGLLVGSKLLTIQVPFVFKYIVEYFESAGVCGGGEGMQGVVEAATTVPLSLLIMYGAMRTGATFCHELRNTIFAKVFFCLVLFCFVLFVFVFVFLYDS